MIGLICKKREEKSSLFLLSNFLGMVFTIPKSKSQEFSWDLLDYEIFSRSIDSLGAFQSILSVSVQYCGVFDSTKYAKSNDSG